MMTRTQFSKIWLLCTATAFLSVSALQKIYPFSATPAKTTRVLSTDWTYTLEDAKNNSCIMIETAIFLDIPYMDKHGEINLASFRVPTILNISGSCLAGFINLTWNSPTVWKENSLELWFGRNSTHFYLWRITAKVFQDSKHFTSLTDFPHYENFSGDYLSDYYMQFATPIGHSFTCNGVVVFNGLNRWESVSFNGPRFEAFREGLPGRREFSPGLECGRKIPPLSSLLGAWPIVGIVIGAIALISVLAYFIWRRYTYKAL
ncbi:uncharacterized protein LOC110862497 [Folsomia candida]|uniref:uncharacterized protein LOC110862497 n=1 Tax=Folsomia candida TaxID=158441 RepID=UPI000B8EFA4E|nr:uncharacterized protein LOC110862497 [Folsomia candida]